MTKPIQGKDGKFQGSVGEGKLKVPTPAPPAARSVQEPADKSHASYEEQFNAMKAASPRPTRVENGVTWTEARREVRGDGWTVLDERATGTYCGLRSEGYTGVKPSEPVDVNRTQYIRPDNSVSSEHYSCSTAGGAWLAVHDAGNDLHLDGLNKPMPERRIVTSLITAGASFRIYRHSNSNGSQYTWSADGTFPNPMEPGTTTEVPGIWVGERGPSEKDLQEAAERYRRDNF